MKKDKKEFIKSVIILSFPVVLQQLLNTLLNMTDTVMIGAVGEMAISGIAVSNKIFFIYQLILFGLSNGVGIYLSQFNGSEKREKVTDVFNYGLRLCVGVSIIAVAIVIGFGEDIVKIYLNDQYTIKIAVNYLNIMTLSFVPFAISNMYSVGARVLGKPKLTLVSGSISFLVNIILNYVLIFGHLGFPELSESGAAIATSIARLVEMAILIKITSASFQHIHLKYRVEMNKKLKLDLIAKAFPLMINELIWSIGLNIIFINYSYISESSIPAITVTDSISNLVYVAFSGISVAISIVIGKQLGSGDKVDLIRRNVRWIIQFCLLIYIFGGAVLIATSGISPIIFSLEESNIRIASILIIIKAFTAWTQGYSNTVYYVLRSGGDTKSVLIIDGIFTWVGPVLISIIMARLLNVGIISTYLCVEGVGIIKVLLSTYFLKKEKWIRNLTLG